MEPSQDQRASAALARIDRALARIEALSAIQKEPPRATAELERLRAAHDLLRRRVQGAIGEIDALLAPSGGGDG
jgi:hypothetical protein